MAYHAAVHDCTIGKDLPLSLGAASLWEIGPIMNISGHELQLNHHRLSGGGGSVVTFVQA